MSSSRIPSPARSHGGSLTPKRAARSTRSVGSPMTPGRLSTVLDQLKENNPVSFALSPMDSRVSILSDNTEIEQPRNKSWWKRLDDSSRDMHEVLEANRPELEADNVVMDYLDVEILSQEQKNYTVDLPESSSSETIDSIIIPQRKLFSQKNVHPEKKYANIVESREKVTKINKENNDKNTTIDTGIKNLFNRGPNTRSKTPFPAAILSTSPTESSIDDNVVHKSTNAGTKNLFNKGTNVKPKPAFPAVLLPVTPNKTLNKTKEANVLEIRGQVRNLFGNRAGTKRKNMFADFIISESEDEIPDIQPKVFGFHKKTEVSRPTRATRQNSETSSVTMDLEMDDWKMLPSSTMVENQLEQLMSDVNTPSKRLRLSNLSEAKESDDKMHVSGNKSKSSNKSKSKNKTEISKESEPYEIKLSKSRNINNSKAKEKTLTEDQSKSNVTVVQNETVQDDEEDFISLQYDDLESDSEKNTNHSQTEHNNSTLKENSSNKSESKSIGEADNKEKSVNRSFDVGQVSQQTNNENIKDTSSFKEIKDKRNSIDHDAELSDDQDEVDNENINQNDEPDEIEVESEVNDSKISEEHLQQEDEVSDDDNDESAESQDDQEAEQNYDDEASNNSVAEEEIEEDEEEIENSNNEEVEKSEHSIEIDEQDEISEEGSDAVIDDSVAEDQEENNDDDSENDNEVQESETNDTETNKSSQQKEPEDVLYNVPNTDMSFFSQAINTSIRKTKSMIQHSKRIAKPSLAPERQSSSLYNEGTGNSSAEGSGWDSHRTTRKTLRQTFGKEFTPRKSLRALVMEKTVKRQTVINEANAELNLPEVNSTELPGISMQDDDMHEDYDDVMDEAEESSHEISKRTRESNLEMRLDEIRKTNMEKRIKLREAVLRSLEAPSKYGDHVFKVPSKPGFKKATIKPQSKPKTKPNKQPFYNIYLPKEILEDMKYKPPKRFAPSNAPWATKRLYNYLETKLEPKYDYKARVRAEKLVETIYNFTKVVKRHKVAPPDAVSELKAEMARLEIVRTHFDFYQFFRHYLSRDIRVKVNPSIINNIPVPEDGVFSEILR